MNQLQDSQPTPSNAQENKTPEDLLAEALKGKTERFQRRVLDFASKSGLSQDDPLFLVLIATGHLEAMLEEAPDTLHYLKQVSIHFGKVLQQNQQDKLNISGKMLQKVKQVASTDVNNINSQQIEEKLIRVKNLLKDCVAELGNELQIATDGAKSALRPDNSIIAYCQAITDYKEVQWLSEKKNSEAFTNRGMKSNGYSPIDLMIQQTNQIFEQSQVYARPIEQFKQFYPEIEVTDQQKEQAQKIKTEYNSLIKQRITLEDRKKLEQGPYLVITSATSSRQLEITNLIKFDVAKNSDFWKASELNIRIQSRTPSPKMPHPLKATIKYFDADGQAKDITIGTISMKSMKEYDLKPGISLNQGKVEFHFGISDGMIDALKQQTTEYVESVRNSTPETEKLQLAAAIHDITHTQESKNYQGIKRAGVAFAVFPDEVVGQLQQLQFTDMRIIGAQFNECAGINFKGEQVAIKFEDGANPRDPTKTARWVTVEGKRLGTIDARSPQLIAGCEALATITSSPSNSLIVTSLKNPDNKLQIDNTDKYTFAGRDWKEEQTSITFNVQQCDTGKAPVVVALLGNQALGVLNKQSANFLLSQLANSGKKIQGLTITGIINNAPASYADIVIDPSSFKLPDIQPNNKLLVARVVFFEASVDNHLQQSADQMMCNMLLRAVDRAIERGYNTIHFVDISPHQPDNPSPAVKMIQELGATRQDINIEYFDVASPKGAITNLTQPDDIALGIRSKDTINIIGYAANQGKAVAAYIPETGKFDRYNLPPIEKTVTATKNEIERDA